MINTGKKEKLLSLRGVKKSFGPVKALRGVDLDVGEAEVHGLIGENGAGKSTLMKILSGAHSADAGEIFFKGEQYSVKGPAEARAKGIAMIYQELTLAPHLTVEENITLGVEISSAGFVKHERERIRNVLEWMGHGNIDIDLPLPSYSINIQQVVEIARALACNAKLIIMDEPTSSLSAEDTKLLFKTIGRLKDRGISVIYISHFLEEVQEVCDRYTVLRDGETVASGDMASVNITQLIEHMVGRSLDEMYPNIEHSIKERVLEVSGLKGKTSPSNVSFSLRKGEILGIAGLVGSGRSETIRSVFGLNSTTAGDVKMEGRPDLKATYVTPDKALKTGFDLLSEDRKLEGLATGLSISTNITLSGLKKYVRGFLVNLSKERESADKGREDLAIKCRDVSDPVLSLSGGNQQKVALARLLHHDSDIFFLDEPTRGIDVGSKAEIYRLMQGLAAKGKAIIFVSSYLPELMGVCDTLAVMYRGEMSRVKPVSEWSEHDIMLFATSGAEA